MGRNKKAVRLNPMQRTQEFFEELRKDPQGQKLLREQNHRVEFDLSDGKPFYVEIKNGRVVVKPGFCQPRRFDRTDLIQFRLDTKTLNHLLDGERRFTDALIPTDPKGRDCLLLMNCTLFKWSVLNWVGRLFRAGQLPTRFRV